MLKCLLWKGVARLGATSFLIIATIAFSGIPVLAIEYGNFGGRPAYPREENPRTDSIFVHTLEAGAIQQDGVTIINNSSEPKTLIVYAADSVRSTDGAFACRQQVEPKEDVGAWIALTENEVTLNPAQSKIVPFTITVPGNASVGEHNGCILIQEKKEQVEGSGVQLSFRTGLRVAITIPGELIRKLEVADFRISSQEDKDFLLHPEVRNTGNVSIDASIKIVTRSIFGFQIAVHGGQYPVLRGESSAWNFELKRPSWGGWYRSTLSVAYDSAVGAGVGIETEGEKTVLNGHSRWFFSFPSWQAWLVYIVILISAYFGVRTLVRRRQLARWIAKSWVEVQVVHGETINSVAESCGLDWKLIAKTNKLKPPYALTPGQTLRLPPKRRSTSSSVPPAAG